MKLKGTSFKVGTGSTKVGSQVKYGPTADLSDAQKKKLLEHYGTHGKGKTQQNALTRLSQYSSSHSTFVKAAESSKRPLTAQELTAKRTGQNAPNASINHVIAAGTGQNVLNHETLRFQEGAKRTQDGLAALKKDPASQAAKKQVAQGLAQQAASVGRTQGYSRATLNERQGELTQKQVLDKRRDAMQGTLTALQGKDSRQRVTGDTPAKRFDAYKGVMKDTFDAPGNLRVGDRTQNTKVSTGFDAPLDKHGKPTSRAERLHDAHQTYAPDRLLKDDRVFTKDDKGNVMSSSMETDGVATAARKPKRKANDSSDAPATKRKR
ncbi:hypothetical protein [Myxococcus sp. RHSTA-1-4]|uniref:hypothetical protein n=1 Tax=Myxococcus sp. RHSTA-1-4 TaxID=2874601 RepID=UPI001CBE30F9|nr:hypothetical protein [Myxococcus sp. RHSTA-1-4]MBZ4422359.1 hypothetical protein [Myxococcus sp. RHSTA-1-4]